MSVRRPARVDGKPTVNGHLSETDLRSVGSCTLRGGRRLLEVIKLKQYELYERDIMYMYITHFIFSLVSNSNLNRPTIVVQN